MPVVTKFQCHAVIPSPNGDGAVVHLGAVYGPGHEDDARAIPFGMIALGMAGDNPNITYFEQGKIYPITFGDPE